MRNTAFYVLMLVILEKIKSMNNDDNFKKNDIYWVHFILVIYSCVKNYYKI